MEIERRCNVNTKQNNEMYPIFHVQDTHSATRIIRRKGVPANICNASNDIFVADSPRRVIESVAKSMPK